MQRLREILTLTLIGLLPFHALGVTVLTKALAGSGNAPIGLLAAWKEILIGMICIIAIIEILSSKELRSRAIRFDRIDVLGILFCIIAIGVSILQDRSIAEIAYGIKYDLLPIAILLILRRVEWSAFFQSTVGRLLLAVGVIVGIYGIVALFLPQAFFMALGYSDLHSLYVPSGSLAPFQQLGGSWIRRMQSVMSGPNQLGMWLLIPLSICLVSVLRSKVSGFRFQVSGLWQVLFIGLCIDLTFSRAAWVGAAAMIVMAIVMLRPWMQAKRWLGWLGIAAIVLGAIVLMVKPDVIIRAASSRGHIQRPIAAIRDIVEHPMGMGLAAAGPANARFSDACVELEYEADVAWAESHLQLCLFIQGHQVQPADRGCDCPILPENWYLQIGIETGVVGLIAYLALIGSVIVAMARRLKQSTLLLTTHYPLLTFVGIGIAGLFLHSWEDSAVAYTVWMLAGIAIAKAER